MNLNPLISGWQQKRDGYSVHAQASLFLDHWIATLNDPDQKENDRRNQEHVDKPINHMEPDKTNQPKYQ